MTKPKKQKPVPGPKPIRPPGRPGASLMYKGLWHPVEDAFEPERWPVIDPPLDDANTGPFVFFEGKFYKVELPAETIEALNKPWLELAGALGRQMANRDFEKQKAFMDEFNALCPMPKAEVRGHLVRLYAKHEMLNDVDETMAAVEAADEPFGGFRF